MKKMTHQNNVVSLPPIQARRQSLQGISGRHMGDMPRIVDRLYFRDPKKGPSVQAQVRRATLMERLDDAIDRADAWIEASLYRRVAFQLLVVAVLLSPFVFSL